MSTLKRTAAALTLTAFTGATFAQAPLQKIGKGEGQVDIVAWAGYIERGATDKAFDWVTEFEKKTSCKVNVKTAGTSDEMVALMNEGGFDLVTASGDASLARGCRSVPRRLVPRRATTRRLIPRGTRWRPARSARDLPVARVAARSSPKLARRFPPRAAPRPHPRAQHTIHLPPHPWRRRHTRRRHDRMRWPSPRTRCRPRRHARALPPRCVDTPAGRFPPRPSACRWPRQCADTTAIATESVCVSDTCQVEMSCSCASVAARPVTTSCGCPPSSRAIDTSCRSNAPMPTPKTFIVASRAANRAASPGTVSSRSPMLVSSSAVNTRCRSDGVRSSARRNLAISTASMPIPRTALAPRRLGQPAIGRIADRQNQQVIDTHLSESILAE